MTWRMLTPNMIIIVRRVYINSSEDLAIFHLAAEQRLCFLRTWQNIFLLFRFIHCSKEEEDNYVITKTLPLRLKYQYDFGIGDYFLGHNKSSSENKHLPAETSGRPVCRDYLNGDCRRGKKCKFAHVDQEQIALLTVEAEKGLGLKQESGVKRPRMLVEENLTISSDYCNLRSNPTAVTCIPTSK